MTDFQCGFKASAATRALELLPLVEDEGWFFDTELLVTAERLGVRVSEIPVEWTDDPDSRVHLVATAAEDLKGMWRVAHGRHAPCGAPSRQARPRRRTWPPPTSCSPSPVSGVLSTLSYLLLFSRAGGLVGPWLANALALGFCTVVNTALHTGAWPAGGRAATRPRLPGPLSSPSRLRSTA